MPYLKILPRYPERNHNCELPVGPIKTGRGSKNVGPGSLWQCQICKQVWELYHVEGTNVNEWHPITEKGAENELAKTGDKDEAIYPHFLIPNIKK